MGERGGAREVEETHEKCDNKKDAEGSKHAAFLIYFGRLDADYGREGAWRYPESFQIAQATSSSPLGKASLLMSYRLPYSTQHCSARFLSTFTHFALLAVCSCSLCLTSF